MIHEIAFRTSAVGDTMGVDPRRRGMKKILFDLVHSAWSIGM